MLVPLEKPTRDVRFSDAVPYKQWLNAHSDVRSEINAAENVFAKVRDWAMGAPDVSIGSVLKYYKRAFGVIQNAKADIEDYAKVEKELIRKIKLLEEVQQSIKTFIRTCPYVD